MRTNVMHVADFDGEARIGQMIAEDVRQRTSGLSNGAQTGPRIGVEEGPPFRD
ncbi:hypothetical protein GGQ82_002342 [Sphingobium olei]